MGLLTEVYKITDSFMALYMGDTKDPFETRVRNSTCVVRALEHATGVKATPGEFTRRLRDIDSLREIARKSVRQTIRRNSTDITQIPKKLEPMRAEIGRLDLQSIGSLTRDIRRTNTPLGDALKCYSVRPSMLNPGGIYAELAKGHKVLLTSPRHIENVFRDALGYLRSSDGFRPLSLRGDQKVIILEENHHKRSASIGT